ncbi:hypothetical protein DVR09_15665 (plasmid) [Erythrobacter aureus]|uniref:Uncharacterized protein n=2 Tax=Erythrobacter aureus TaxID=2182384 RepID=A0A345YIY8_9SPHN|nr:hypothetical protein DVR09_15665 [Erythrobacter aureus]
MAMHYIAHVGARTRALDNEFKCLLFLADWKSCLIQGKQITDLEWTFAPTPTAEDMPFFPMLSIREKVDQLLGRKPAFLSNEDVEALDHVISVTCGMRTHDVIRLANSTYPGLTNDRGEVIDLPLFAKTKSIDPWHYGPKRLPAHYYEQA